MKAKPQKLKEKEEQKASQYLSQYAKTGSVFLFLLLSTLYFGQWYQQSLKNKELFHQTFNSTPQAYRSFSISNEQKDLLDTFLGKKENSHPIIFTLEEGDITIQKENGKIILINQDGLTILTIEDKTGFPNHKSYRNKRRTQRKFTEITKAIKEK